MTFLTEAEAKERFCPKAQTFDGKNGHGNRWLGDKFDHAAANEDGDRDRPLNVCMASRCMAWRWGDEVLKEPPRRIWWPETDEVTVLRGVGPDRSDKVPASAQWVPLTGGDEADDHAGAYWEEAADEFKARVIKARDSRRGFCGAFGQPRVTP